MIDEARIAEAVATVAREADPERILLFGSHARGDAREDCDLDLLVVERNVVDRGGEMVRLRRALRPLRIPVDIMVVSTEEVATLGGQTGTALYWALKEGRVVYG